MVANIGDNENHKEDLLSKATGGLGRWQIFLIVILSVPCKMSVIWMMLGIIFFAPKTHFRCAERMNATEIINSTCYSDCGRYEYYSEFDTTIISQFELICERAWLVNLTQTIFMFGVLIGSMIFGFVADRYGRRPALLIASMLQLSLSLILPFSPSFWSFTAIRFFLGTSSAGLMVISFVIVVEITAPSKRELVTSFYHIPLALGEMIMPLFAYYLRSWMLFSAGVGVPNLIFLLYLFVVPESARWLISMGRLEEASEVIKKAANFNKIQLDNALEIAQSIANENNMNITKEKPIKVSYIDLLINPNLRLKNLYSCISWLILGISFYGGNQYIGQTSSNVFLTIVLAGALQIPGMCSSGYLYKRFGRKPTVIGYYLVCSVCNAIMAVPDDWFYVKLISGAVAVSSAAGAFSTMYAFTTELFPTVARNMAMGASSTTSRIGSMIAPFIAGMQNAPWIPPVVFAVAPLIAAGVCFCLPETKGKKLLDTLHEK